MMRRIKRQLKRYLSPAHKAYIKAHVAKLTKLPAYVALRKVYFTQKKGIIEKFYSYNAQQLASQLRSMGLATGDTVLLHSAFNPYNGFTDGPQKVIECLLQVIGSSGNLLMVSMGYHGMTTQAYLRSGEKFDVLKTMSSMGIISELFRRQKGVLRSLNPAHPVLACGPDATWLVADHHTLLYSCGPGSPFEKALQLHAKALFFDTSFSSMTFYHYVEDRFQQSLSVPLYHEPPIESTIVDPSRNEVKIKVYVFSEASIQRRSIRKLGKALRKQGALTIRKIGNTTLQLVNLSDVVDYVQKMVEAGKRLY
jgi:aminoglycoside 3-N-acetyltransferase